MTDLIKFGKEQTSVYERTISCLRKRIFKLKIDFEREIHNDIKVRIEREIMDCRNAIKDIQRKLERVYLIIVAIEKA